MKKIDKIVKYTIKHSPILDDDDFDYVKSDLTDLISDVIMDSTKGRTVIDLRDYVKSDYFVDIKGVFSIPKIERRI